MDLNDGYSRIVDGTPGTFDSTRSVFNLMQARETTSTFRVQVTDESVKLEVFSN